MRKPKLLLTATLAAAPFILNAGGFQLPFQGSLNGAFGGAGAALPLDASTIFYNPAGLTTFKSWNISLNAFLASPNVRFTAPTGDYYADNVKHTSPPFGVYFGGPITKDKKLSAGFGVYTPFGNRLDWGKDWAGKYIVQNITLHSFYFQPTLAYQITPELSIGAGLVYGYGHVDITQALPIQSQDGTDGQAQLKGNAHKFGYNVGVQYKPLKELTLGANFRSGLTFNLKNGDATFTTPASVASLFPANKFNVSLPLAHILTVGGAYKFNEHLTATVDLIYSMWSRYDSLQFKFADQTSTVKDISEPRMYKNTFGIRGGVNYDFCTCYGATIGFAYDPTPSKNNLVSPDAVDANRYTIYLGFHYAPNEHWKVSAMAGYTMTPNRAVTYDVSNFSGNYKITNFTPGVGVTYQF